MKNFMLPKTFGNTKPNSKNYFTAAHSPDSFDNYGCLGELEERDGNSSKVLGTKIQNSFPFKTHFMKQNALKKIQKIKRRWISSSFASTRTNSLKSKFSSGKKVPSPKKKASKKSVSKTKNINLITAIKRRGNKLMYNFVVKPKTAHRVLRPN
mmetsp:Transcript_8894/g.7880  ORF Transcript_8894/g.7880 Transcript_8894/m.7880 type:complete len:153 (+) Transcript_8894:815-1273(+)